jgi:hypothetical protein
VNDYWHYIAAGNPGTAPLGKYTPSTAIPRDLGPGDVVSYGKVDPGHTNVVISVNVNSAGDGTMVSLNQNYSDKSEVTQTVKDWTPGPVYTLAGAPMVATGWLHDTPTSPGLAPYGLSCASGSYCVVVGVGSGPSWNLAVAERWQGGAWTALPQPHVPGTPAELLGVSCTGVGHCIAVGGYCRSSTTTVTCNGGTAEYFYTGIIYKLTGTTWHQMKISTPKSWQHWEPVSVSCPASSSCMVVGWYHPQTDDNPAVTLPMSLHWNGKKWSSVRVALPPATPPGFDQGAGVSFVSCGSPTRCVAVGEGVFADRPDWQSTLTEVWTGGSSWRLLSSPNGVYADSYLYGVSCGSPGTCMAVGGSDDMSCNNFQTLRLFLHGSRWTKLRSLSGDPTSCPNDNPSFGVSCVGDRWCMVVAGQAIAGSRNTEVWSNGKWRPLPSYAEAPLSCPSASKCLASGELWNGVKWVALPT